MTAAMPDLLREIVAYCREAGHDWSSLTEAEHHLAALSPQAVPMTDERLAEVLTTAYGSPEWTMDDVRAARSVEAAALGITAQGAQGGEVDEREEFEAWFDDYYDKACAEFGGIDCTDPKGIAEDAWQARASLPTQPAAQATPEPVGEVSAESILNQWMAECGVYMVEKMGHQWASQTKQADLLYLVEKTISCTRPAPGVPEDVQQLVRELVKYIERNTCTHEETHRGGAIWEICDACGSMWADDEGGKPEFVWPEVVEQARTMLAAAQAKGDK